MDRIEDLVRMLIQAAREREAAARIPDCVDGAQQRLEQAKDALIAAYEVMARSDGWLPIESAPYAMHFLAARFGDCEWEYSIIMREDKGPFTHWQPLPEAPAGVV